MSNIDKTAVRNPQLAPQAMLEVQNIWKTYRMGKKSLDVLKDISLVIHKGEFISISGPSGAGKSTLLHILGLLDEPSRGVYSFNGEHIHSVNNRKKAVIRNKSIGFIFQFFYLLPEFTAFENVMMPALIAKSGGSAKEIEQRAGDLLTKVGLGQRLKHRPQELSGGEQQRVAIARALINQPDVILADEPTGNLDTETGREIQDLLQLLHHELSLTVVVVTHNDHLASICPRHVTMFDGHLKTV
ncbi:ABC transporter ATP-binding protein [bacterium]|nr:ABC transporter ATP-binding protein [bacterium]MCP5462508.1 ABC transporter ATP-binding protein [bacterium]